MSDITAFLLARIAEDEAKADALVASEVARCRSDGMPDTTAQDIRAFWGEQVWWRRQLAEIKAKRRIVELMRRWDGPRPYVPEQTLALLALPYADHPEFDPAWRVG